MKEQNFFDYINVDGFSSTPKYLQLANSIQEAVISGKITTNKVLPSLHELTYHLEISKETAERGYKYLRNLGILSTIPGKGHYITANNIEPQKKIFLLINKLSTSKKIFYDALSERLGERAVIDFYIYNDDYSLFKNLLNSRRTGYSHYVIVPHFAEGGESAHKLINTIPKDKLILVNNSVEGVVGHFGGVYDNCRKNIYEALEKALQPLSKYDTIKLIYPKQSYFVCDILKGFNLFCQQYAFERTVVDEIAEEPIHKGEVFICLSDDDLILLIERVKKQNLVLGEDIGIISYNESPLKKFILNGITTISADFKQMGIKTAEMINGSAMQQIELESCLNLRGSL